MLTKESVSDTYGLSRRTLLQGTAAAVLSSAAVVPSPLATASDDTATAIESTEGLGTLNHAWNAFCGELRRAGQIPLTATLPMTEQDRVAGYLQLFRNLSLAFDFHYEFNDPLFPEFFRYFGPTRKQGGDNCDAVYLGAAVSEDYDYRISGHLGSARYLSVVLVDEGDTPWGGRTSTPPPYSVATSLRVRMVVLI